MESNQRKREAASPILLLVAGGSAVLVGSFADDLFPDVDPLLVQVIAAVAVGLAFLAVSILVGRLRPRR